MILNIYYDNQRQKLEISDDTDFSVMLEDDYQSRLDTVEDRKAVKKFGSAQEFFDAENRIEFNSCRRANDRHDSYQEGESVDRESTGISRGLRSYLLELHEKEEQALFKRLDSSRPSLLATLIAKLPIPQQEAVKAVYFDELSEEEFANKISISQPAVSRRLSNAKKNLKKLFSEAHISSSASAFL